MKTFVVAVMVLMLGTGLVTAQEMKGKLHQSSKTKAKTHRTGEITVKDFPAMKAVTVVVKAANYEPSGGYKAGREGTDEAYSKMMDDAFKKLGEWMKSGGKPAGPPFSFYFNDPAKTETKELTAKVGFPVGPDAKAEGDLTVEDIPAMTAAVIQYKGPYEGSWEVWNEISKWIPEHGYQFAGAPMEVYLKGGAEHSSKAADYMTEIRWPVTKAGEAKPGEPQEPHHKMGEGGEHK